MKDINGIIITFISGLFSGGFLGYIINHHLALHREGIKIRDDFRGFLGNWLSGTKHASDISALHAGNLRHLWGYYGRVCRHILRKQKFKTLCEDLDTTKEIEGTDYRGAVSQKIEALIEFV